MTIDRSHFVLHYPPKCVESSFIVFYVKDADRFPLYMFELIMDDAWGIKDNSLPYGVFLTQFLIQRGVAIGDGETRKEVMSAVNKFTLSRSKGQEGALTRRFTRRVARRRGAARASTDTRPTRSKAPLEMGEPAVPPPGWPSYLWISTAVWKRSEQNKKNRSKLTVNHAAGSRSFQRTRACMKNQESGEINPAELYKKNYTNKDGFGPRKEREKFILIYFNVSGNYCHFLGTDGCLPAQCDLEGKTYTEIEVYSEILGKKSGYVRGLGRAVKPPPSSTLTTQSSDLQHQLAKARDEIEAMRAAREKDLQEFAKKQAEMEATLRDHREEQWVEQERIRLE
ncbi:hypothetical protein CJ030_MR8G016486 [Morella rubra]|uniref:Uncharacterized protein n=1 Tax=Morella rubra TaxID=262757 RepID=A0A6A1USY2_9ROSI|nr:hypothetical protein CJ030_MR8G016486 [Morella rubra]